MAKNEPSSRTLDERQNDRSSDYYNSLAHVH